MLPKEYVPMKFLFLERMPTNTTISAPIKKDVKAVALCAWEKSHQIAIKNPPVREEFVSSKGLPRSSGQICNKYQKKKDPRMKQSAPSAFLSPGDTIISSHPRPRVEASTQLRIVFDKQNGNRNNHISTSFHQPFYRFLGDPVPSTRSTP